MRFAGTFCFFVLGVAAASGVSADIINFRLTGNGGDGLLDSNVTPATGSSGFGALGISGITFDTVDRVLHVHVEWGSGNGYGDLTGDVTMLHWHGPTTDLPPDSFSQTGLLMINLALGDNFVADGTGGGVNNNYLVEPDDVIGLLQGRTYINVHTDMFPTGEIRGYLVRVVPEPGVLGLATMILTGFCLRRRR